MARKRVKVNGVDVSGLPLVGYYRASKDGRREEISVTDQRADVDDWAEREGETIAEHVTDNDRSGMPDAPEREGWARVMDMVRTCRYGGIAPWDADRVARDTWISAQLIRMVDDLGLKGFRVTGPGGTYDLSDPSDRTDFTDAVNRAQREGVKIRGRVTRGMRRKARRGQLTGGTARRFGFTDAYTNTHHGGEVAEMHAALERLRNGVKVAEVLKDWAERGVRTVETKLKNGKVRGGVPFTPSSFRNMMLRPLNHGLLTADGGKEITGRLPGEPIFDVEQWGFIRSFYAGSSKGRPVGSGGAYLLSGVDLLYCADCQSRMTGQSLGKRGYALYRCQYNKANPDRRKGCYQSATMAGVDAYVKAVTLARWSDRTQNKVNVAAMATLDEQERRLQARLDRAERGLRIQREKFGEGAMDDELFAELLAEGIAERNRARAALAEVRERRMTPVYMTYADAAAKWEAEDIDGKREMVRAVIKRVTLSPSGVKTKVFDTDRIGFGFREPTPVAA